MSCCASLVVWHRPNTPNCLILQVLPMELILKVLFISDGTYLYGMTVYGGAYNDGVVFKIKPDGTGYVKLLDFDSTTNGANP